MKDITCLKNWYRGNCCGDNNMETFLHGVKIVDGVSHIGTHLYPFAVYLKREKFVIVKDSEEHHYQISGFNQSYAQIRDLFARCVFGSHGTDLKRKVETHVVDNGNQNTFLAPLDAGETHLGIEYYSVYVGGVLVGEGVDELEYTLVNGNVFFTIAIEDLTPDEDATIIDIVFWVQN